MDDRILDDLTAQVRDDQLSRRTFLTRGLALGASVAGLAALSRGLKHRLRPVPLPFPSRPTTGSAAPPTRPTLAAWARRATG